MPVAASRYQFPQDLGTETQRHWMLITAKGSGNAADPVSVALPMPGQSSGSNLAIGSRHEYNEMKLTKVAADAASSVPLIGGMLGGAINAAAGAAPMVGGAINPKVEVLYRDTGLRDFQFSWILAPTSATESQSLASIIRALRQYSSPTLVAGNSDPRSSYIGIAGQSSYLGSSGGGIFKTPYEFWIQFFYLDEKTGQQVENRNIPLVGRCVLQTVEAMYNPNAEWSTFHDASPLSVQLILAFKEMRVIDSNNIYEGY